MSGHLHQCTYSLEEAREAERLARLRAERERRDEGLLDSWHAKERPGGLVSQQQHLAFLREQAELAKEEQRRAVEEEEKIELELLNARDTALEDAERRQVAARRVQERNTMLQNQRLAQARVKARARAREAQIRVEQTLLEREEFERKFGQSIC